MIKVYVGIAVVAASALSFAGSPIVQLRDSPSLQPVAQPEVTSARIEFHTVHSDQEIRELLLSYEVTPYMIYLANGGYSGVSAVRKTDATLDLIDTARVAFRAHLDVTRRSRDVFLKRYASGEILLHPSDVTLLRNLFAGVQNFEFALGQSTEAPIIYAAEVIGTATALNAISQDSRVSAVHGSSTLLPGVATSRPQPPDALRPEAVVARFISQAQSVSADSIRTYLNAQAVLLPTEE